MIRPCCAENSPNLSMFIFFRYDANYFAIFPMRVIIIDFSEYVNYPLLSLRAFAFSSVLSPAEKHSKKPCRHFRTVFCFTGFGTECARQGAALRKEAKHTQSNSGRLPDRESKVRQPSAAARKKKWYVLDIFCLYFAAFGFV